MEIEVNKMKHDVFVGNHVGQNLDCALHIGYALKYENLKYYILKLWPFPNVTYYLSTNRGSSDKFTVFTKKVETETSVHFQNPVGYAVLRGDLKDYLEINLRLPKQKVYMSIYPSN